MYEDKTFDKILSGMLDRVPEDLDKREGSIVYNALAPCAYELAQAYYKLGNFLELVFIDTSAGDYLTRICSQFGVRRKPATSAVIQASFSDSAGAGFDVSIGSRFGANGLIYTVTAKVSTGIYKLTCETSGIAGNLSSGELLPVDYASGLAAARVTAIITYAEDEETDEALRERTLTKIQNPSTSGSANDYLLWALSVQGVGDAKVFPLWNGNGTVKAVIIGTDKKAAGSGIVSAVAAFIESVRPIGASVTVESAAELTINISVSVVKSSGYTLAQVTENITAAIEEYLSSTAFKQGSVSFARIGNAILDAAGVLDYSALSVNGGTSNIPVSLTAGRCQTPVIGTVTVT